MRIMALDVGDRRIGIAISDPLGFTAQGHSVLERKSKEKDYTALKNICEEYQVEKIIVGLPINMNGSVGPRALLVQDFGRDITEFTGLEVDYWDERLSTVSAQKVLLEADISRKKRKGLVDKLAAVYILQAYLDRQCSKR